LMREEEVPVNKKTIGQFDYRIFKMRKDDSVPFTPIVEVLLQHWKTGNLDNTPTISPHLMTEEEIDDHIQALKADLDAIGNKAKSALLRAKEGTAAIGKATAS
jgi:hypothetical protein